MGDVTQLPPHPGSFWQECTDSTTGYPYYWNTLNNQVVWECPSELIQYRHSLLSLPPPVPPPPPSSTTKQAPITSSLVAGYDSDDDNSDIEEVELVSAEDLEQDPEFIGPKKPPPASTQSSDETEPEKETGSEEPEPPGVGAAETNGENRQNGHNGTGDAETARAGKDPEESIDDILTKIEAEQPPDYQVYEYGPQAQPPSSVFSLPPPPPPPGGPPPPPSTQGPSSISLLSSYADSDLSDTEDEEENVQEVKKSKLKPVTGQLDSSGRIMFPTSGTWQTAEQKAALDSYIQREEPVDSKVSSEKEPVAVNSRKRRIALPGGKFNKRSDTGASKSNGEEDPKSKYAVQFVKSNTGIPGSKEKPVEEEKEDADARMQRLLTAGPRLPTPEEEESIEGLTEDELAEELVEKLEFFKVGDEKITSLKLLAVKIETLYSAWTAGALTPKYLKIFLENAHRRIKQTEAAQLSVSPWTARWDRKTRRYMFKNSETQEVTAENPHLQTELKGSTKPPIPSETVHRPPLPPAPSPPPPRPPSSEDNVPQDMDLEEDEGDEESSPSTPDILTEDVQAERSKADRQASTAPTEEESTTVNLTDELSSFYSEIGYTDPVAEEMPEYGSPIHSQAEDSNPPTEDLRPPGEDNNTPRDSSEGDSAPASPAPPSEAKRRKKAVKVTNSLSMKKKGLNSMLAKWQNIK